MNKKIFFILFTCESYKNTRKLLQEKYILNNCTDYIYISAKEDLENKILGFNTNDGYDSMPFKYIEFFKYFYKNKNNYNNYDYFFFGDDDVAWLKDNLNNYLLTLKNDEPSAIGKYHPGCIWEGRWSFCGGAGIILNKSAMLKVSEYVTFEENLFAA